MGMQGNALVSVELRGLKSPNQLRQFSVRNKKKTKFPETSLSKYFFHSCLLKQGMEFIFIIPQIIIKKYI